MIQAAAARGRLVTARDLTLGSFLARLAEIHGQRTLMSLVSNWFTQLPPRHYTSARRS